MAFNLKSYIDDMRTTLRTYESMLDKSWRGRLNQLEVLNRATRDLMLDALAEVPKEARATKRGKLQLTHKIENIYSGWAKRVDKIFELPRIKKRGKGGGTPTVDAVKDRAAMSLGTAKPTQASRPPTGNLFAEAAKKTQDVITKHMKEEFPDEVPTAKQLAESIAETVGETNQAYIENISRNLGDMVSKHANELGDRIRTPRPDAGRKGPEGAVGMFSTDAGGKGNRRNLELSHTTHGRAVLRSSTIRAHPDAKQYAVFDLDRDVVLMMSAKQIRAELAGEQALIGPHRAVYPIPLPNDPDVHRDMRDMTGGE